MKLKRYLKNSLLGGTLAVTLNDLYWIIISLGCNEIILSLDENGNVANIPKRILFQFILMFLLGIIIGILSTKSCELKDINNIKSKTSRVILLIDMFLLSTLLLVPMAQFGIGVYIYDKTPLIISVIVVVSLHILMTLANGIYIKIFFKEDIENINEKLNENNK